MKRRLSIALVIGLLVGFLVQMNANSDSPSRGDFTVSPTIGIMYSQNLSFKFDKACPSISQEFLLRLVGGSINSTIITPKPISEFTQTMTNIGTFADQYGVERVQIPQDDFVKFELLCVDGDELFTRYSTPIQIRGQEAMYKDYCSTAPDICGLPTPSPTAVPVPWEDDFLPIQSLPAPTPAMEPGKVYAFTQSEQPKKLKKSKKHAKMYSWTRWR